MSYLVSIATAVPPYKYDQKELLAFMQKALIDRGHRRESRILGYIYRLSGIQSRYSVLPDFTNENEALLFSNLAEGDPSTENRMAVFQQYSGELLYQACQKALQGHDPSSITHVITVTCTGLSAPGLDIEMVERLGLPLTISKSSVNFMGCYGAFHAIRQADYICKADPNAKVLIADIELCTLHFQVLPAEDNLIANSLFADGAAALIVSGQPDEQKPSPEVMSFKSRIVPDGKKDMAWHITSTGFNITLSSYVPDLIEGNIQKLLGPVMEEEFNGREKDHITWAFHPGGRRILDKISEVMKVDKSFLQPSYEVLKEYGNMSSVTILFVLERLWKQIQESSKPVFAAGFGPGLTMEIMTLRMGDAPEGHPLPALTENGKST